MAGFLHVLSALANLATIAAFVLAACVFLTKRRQLSAAFKLLLNYSTQVSLTELRVKLDRLNDLNANDPEQKEDVLNALNDIVGQLRGNPWMSRDFREIAHKMAGISEKKSQLSEPKKRALVSELRDGYATYL